MLPAVAQLGVPGAQELLIVVMIFLMLAVPVAIVAAAVKYFVGNDSTDEAETAALRERVASLEREVERLREERGTASGESDEQG